MFNFGRREGLFLIFFVGAMLIFSGILIAGEVGKFVAMLGAMAVGMGLIEMA